MADSGYTVKVESMGSAHGLGVGCERKRGVRDDLYDFWPEHLDEWDHHFLRWGNTVGGASFWELD